jgi:hypothetical protein
MGAFLRVLLLGVLCAPPVSAFTNFILVGSTGDLAKKYLWEALFIQYVEVRTFLVCGKLLTFYRMRLVMI